MNLEIDEIDSQMLMLARKKAVLLTSELEKTTKVLFQLNKHFPTCKTQEDYSLINRKQPTTQISKPVKSPIKINCLERTHLILISIAFISIAFISIASGYYLSTLNEVEDPLMKSRYLIENLKGDTIDTWKFWKINHGSKFYVNLVNSDFLTEEQMVVVKDVIHSDESLEIDNSISHKGPKGISSTFYLGWGGALRSISEPTKYPIPVDFEINESTIEAGNVNIVFSNSRDTDGYSGFTKSVVDGDNILKSTITIYDTKNLSKNQLATILRHEFGHAIGLAHSTAPEDLMSPLITTPTPYISECDLDAVRALYDGNFEDKVVCKI
jgi:hypothetical protein